MKKHSKMKYRLLASLLLGFLFLIDSLGDSSARAFQRHKGNKNELEMTRITAMFAQKVSSDGTGAAHMRKLGLGESKFIAHEEPSMVLKNEKEVCGTSPKISGEEDDDAVKKSMATLASLPEQMDDDDQSQKKHMTMLEARASKFNKFVTPRSNLSDRNPKCYCSQYSNAEMGVVQRQISEEHAHYSQGTTQIKDETKNLNEAAKEIVNMMHKDYKGMANKPPINNDEPRN